MDLHGWDMVCACSVPRLNDLLAAQFKATPASLTYSDNSGLKLDIKFDAWRIVAGGTVEKLVMQLPVNSGTLTSPLISGKLDGAVIEIILELAFVDNKAAGKSDLRFNLTRKITNKGDTTKGGVYVSDPDKTGVLAQQDPTGALAMSLHDSIADSLIANAAKLDFVFASLNLAPNGDAYWMTAGSSRYAFVPGAKGANDWLAVFTMFSNADTSKFSVEPDESLLDDNSDVCAGLSGNLFLQHIIMPKLPAGFTAPFNMFAMSGSAIVNLGLLACPPVQVSLTHYYPFLSSFNLTVNDDQIWVTSAGSFDITGLAKSSVTFSQTQKMACTFDATKSVLEMKTLPGPDPDYEKHIPWWLYLTAGPAILVFGPLIGGIVVAIVDSVVAAVTTSVAKATSSSGGSISVGDLTAQSIEWVGAGQWTLVDAGLSDALYLRCKI